MPLEKLHIAQAHLKMPDFIYEELLKRKLLDKFLSRSADQQDSDIAWIDSGRKGSIREKRLGDLVAELKLEGKNRLLPSKSKWYRHPD